MPIDLDILDVTPAPSGPTGATGPTGPTGVSGATGATGSTSATGPASDIPGLTPAEIAAYDAAIAKAMADAANAAREKVAAQGTQAIYNDIRNLSPAEIAVITAQTVANGGLSTAIENRFQGETSAQANDRITEAYKALLAKPILSQAAIDAGATVQFVRVGAGGRGEYTVVTPIGYTGPPIVTFDWSPGILPSTGKYTTGTTLGTWSNGDGTYSYIGDIDPTVYTKLISDYGIKGTPKYVRNPDGTVTIIGADGKSVTAKTGTGGVSVTGSTGGTGGTGGTVSTNKVGGIGLDLTATGGASNTSTYVSSDGKSFSSYSDYLTYQDNLETKQRDREAIGKVLADRFSKYGLGSLTTKIMSLARSGATESTITLELENTPEYQMRFAANADRIKKGLAVLSPAEYIANEDSYRQILRAYGLTQFDNDAYVRQFISNDMSPTELSNRVSIAVQRLQNADPTVTKTLRDYYGIGTTDMLAYVLDPAQQLPKIQMQVAAAEIGTAARTQGLEAGVTVSEQLARQGITQAEAQKGYATIADILPSAEKLSAIYGVTLDSYGQSEAEQEVFNSLASAQRKRRGLTQREAAAFSGSSGTVRGSLGTQTGGTF